MRSSSSSTLLSLFALSSLASAFRNTDSLLGWGPSHATLDSFHPKAAKASQEYTLQSAAEQGEECIATLIVSAPGLTLEDIGSTAIIKREYANAGSSIRIPYLQGTTVDNLKSMIDRRLGQCADSTPVVFRKAKAFKQQHRDSRSQWISEIDRLVATNLDKLPAQSIVLISSVNDLGVHYRQKRQISEAEWEEILNEDNAAEDDGSDIGVDTPTRPSSIFDDNSYVQQQQPTATASPVDPNLGLFYRYSFTSAPLILGTLVMLLILIPVVLMAVNALTSIDVMRGLEHKMQGGQLGETKKDQ